MTKRAFFTMVLIISKLTFFGYMFYSLGVEMFNLFKTTDSILYAILVSAVYIFIFGWISLLLSKVNYNNIVKFLKD